MNRRLLGALALTATAVSVPLAQGGGQPPTPPPPMNIPKDDPRIIEVEGGIDWRMKMPSGINIQGSSSYCYSPYASRQRYFGADASIIMDPATTYDGNTLVLHGNGAPQTLGGGPTTRQFAAQLDGFSQAARDNKPHLTPGEMGLRDIRLMEAMYRSADNGGAAVKL